MRSDRSLYQRLNDFALDDESATFKFSNRLARENGWSLTFAKQAIVEYKKFIYLAAISPTSVTPSDVVDQVWHLHLTYSRSYWDEMCAGILGKKIHHGPTKGGGSEDAKYRDLYAATLDAYRAEFGEEPPAAYWPPSDARFEGAAHQRWVDTRTHMVIAWRTIARTAAIGAGAALIGSAGVALAAAHANAGKDDGGLTDLGIIGAIIAALFLTNLFVRKDKKKKEDDSSSSSCSSFSWGGNSSSGGRGSANHDGPGHTHGGESGGEAGGGDGGGGGCSSGCGGGGCGS